MSRLTLIVVGVCAGVVCSSAPRLSATQTFHINVPNKLAQGTQPQVSGAPAHRIMQITRVKATVIVDPTVQNITFTITDSEIPATDSSRQWSPGPLHPGIVGTFANKFPAPPGLPSPTGTACPLNCRDTVSITPPSSADDNRYEIDFTLFSDSVFNLSCRSTTNNADQFQIDVTAVTAANVAVTQPILGMCLESFDEVVRPPNAGNTFGCFTGSHYSVPLAQTAANSSEFPTTQGCISQRPSVDAMLVLDKSGSMATIDSGTSSRIKILHDAVSDFVNVWTPIQVSGDSVGAVPFDTAQRPLIGPVDPATPGTFVADVALTAGGATSIGAGLGTAAPMLTSPGNSRPVILLMSDGQQNFDPLVEPDPRPGHSNQVAIYCQSSTDPNPLCISPTPPIRCMQSNPCDLPAQPPTRIYTVTVGPDNLGYINQEIARVAKGFYLNAESNTNLLRPYFQELLQNFIRFNSYETIRMISDTTPYSSTIPVSTTSRNLEISLMWPSNLGSLRMILTPPGGAPPIVKESESGFISIFQTLPLAAPFDPMGNWKIEVIALAAGTPVATTNQGGIAFNLHAMTDDAGIKTELSVVPADYAAGDNIRVRAKLTQFGSPILGLGTHPGDTIRVDPLKPGQSIGDILSASTASPSSPNPDIQPGAEAKLFNTLQNNPLVQEREPSIVLHDDGKPEHGDDVAGDGIYNALDRAILPGQYSLLISVEGTDPNFVRFSRQQLRTAYVRSVPDAENTSFQTNILRRDNDGLLTIVMTPRFKAGPGCLSPKCGHMGPGFGPYLWFTAPGQIPFRAKDNLDGTYTATMAFTGPRPPQVSLHFLRVFTVIDDSFTPDRLPEPLGPGNVLVPDIMAKKCFGRSMSANVLLFFGTGAFLVGLAVYRPWRRRKQS